MSVFRKGDKNGRDYTEIRVSNLCAKFRIGGNQDAEALEM
jgi:hypothetical protein